MVPMLPEKACIKRLQILLLLLDTIKFRNIIEDYRKDYQSNL